MKKRNQFPTKTTLNLMKSDKQQIKLTTVVPLVILGTLLIGLFAQYGVINRLAEANAAEQAADEAERSLAAAQAELTVYDEVEAEYSRYFSDALFSSDMPQEVLDVMDMLETYLMDKASVSSISLSGRTVLLQLRVEELSITSDIIQSLTTVPMVDYVSVSTATDTGNRGYDITAAARGEDPTTETITTASTVIMTITLREVSE